MKSFRPSAIDRDIEITFQTMQLSSLHRRQSSSAASVPSGTLYTRNASSRRPASASPTTFRPPSAYISAVSIRRNPKFSPTRSRNLASLIRALAHIPCSLSDGGSVNRPQNVTFFTDFSFPFQCHSTVKQYRTLRPYVMSGIIPQAIFLSLTNVIRNRVDDVGNMRGGSLIQ